VAIVKLINLRCDLCKCQIPTPESQPKQARHYAREQARWTLWLGKDKKLRDTCYRCSLMVTELRKQGEDFEGAQMMLVTEGKRRGGRE